MFSNARLTTVCRRLRLGSIRVGAHFPFKAFAVLTILLCLSPREILASEVSIAYAIDAVSQQESGKLVCDGLKSCWIKSAGLNLTISLIFDADMRRTHLRIDGDYGHPGCCYFSGGETSMAVKVGSSIQRFRFFEGRARKQNELIENTYAGTLYLAFRE
jgi:hypothetical protein